MNLGVDQLWWPVHALALAGWAFLLLGSHRDSRPAQSAQLIAGALSLGYLGLFLANIADAGELARDYSPSGVTTFFADPGLRLLGWVHYLAFDLLVGSWEVEEARKTGIARWKLTLCLLLTFMLGPIGLLVFLSAKRLQTRRAPQE
jgi:hypothetical protein